MEGIDTEDGAGLALEKAMTPPKSARTRRGRPPSRPVPEQTILGRGRRRAPSLLFDEVDVGIGGAVAEVVGRKLKAISKSHQVFCITHLPQIAALADAHFLISKEEKGGRTRTAIRQLDIDERVEEIARMAGGKTVTEATRRHAREMLGLK